MPKNLVARNALRLAYSTWTPGIQPSWNVTATRTALLAHEQGQFQSSAMMADMMMRDERLSATLDTLVLGILGLPFSITATDETDETSTRIRDEVWPWWEHAVPEADLAALIKWYILLGIGIGELVWTSGKGEWRPRLRVHHPQHLFWDELNEQYQLSTKDGMVPITPGNGKWVLMTDGARGYMNGYVRSLAIPWLVRQFAVRDWGRYSERHGMPIMLAGIPSVIDEGEKDGFIDELKRLGTETVIPLPQGAADEASYTMDLLEAKDNSWEGFERLITSCNVSFAIRFLGQNLSTEVQGGSYAAAGIHERILGDVIQGWEKKIASHLREQVMLPIVAFNYGPQLTESAPWPHWDTEPPEDQAKRAAVLAQLIPVIDNAERIGQAIDTDALLEAFGIPLIAQGERKFERGKLFAYHLKHGIVSRNEVRESLGQKPRPGQDDLMEPESAGMGGDALSELELADGEPTVRAPSRSLVDGHDYADAVVSSAMSKAPMVPSLEVMAKIIDGASSYEDVSARLASAFPKMPTEKHTRALQRALILWRLNGRHSVTEEL
jgi:phage gp29-like protein